jgi:CRISPR/Cas system type I-B associated protein Csh2 (Cas7 group RAMP superfamily)
LLVLHNASKPLSRKCLRDTLKVNNQRLGKALEALEKQELVVHTARGWAPVRSTGQVLQEEGRNRLTGTAGPGRAQGLEAVQCPLPF